ncbi:uncharacterized protein N7487_010870 [Penicillium crustosum]|uniref:uncharacterized protein n=1 Tax=Penicillium crustosum TaxID=36656 RepID=UPI0023893E98|nr:uncharacterized protein N7487_010870 [Penicillium crustosum]KAJ5393229.1 hypothetical protein N7487_010870 [Penicillium crustosum]
MESNLEFGESLLKGSQREKVQKASKIKSTAISIIIVVLVSLNTLVANLLYTSPVPNNGTAWIPNFAVKHTCRDFWKIHEWVAQYNTSGWTIEGHPNQGRLLAE